MYTFKLTSVPIEQIDDLHAWEWRLGQCFAAHAYPVRLIATARPFSMAEPIRALQRELRDQKRLARIGEPVLRAIDGLLAGGTDDPVVVVATLPDEDRALLHAIFDPAPLLQARLFPQEAMRTGDAATMASDWTAIADALSRLLWSLPWRTDLLHFYERLGERHLRAIDHYLLAWPPPEIHPEALRAQLKGAFGRDVELVDGMPPIISCAYEPHDTYLAPVEPGAPYLAVLLSYELRGEWDATTLHALLDVDFDISVVVDVQTVPRNRARRKMELAYNAARLVTRDDQVLDTRAEQVFTDAQRVLHETTQQGFHLVMIAALVSGDTRAALEQHVAVVSDRLGSTLRLMRVAGVEDQALRLWSPAPTARLDLPRKRWNMLSHGVGCCAGLIGYHGASRTEGILWGIDAVRRAPLFHDPFRNNQAGHMCVLGKTGYGKTWFLNMVTLRAALHGWKVIALDLAENGLRVERAAGMGCRCNLLGLHNAVNILDVVFPPDAPGGWLPLQVQHVIDQLAMLLGEPGTTASGQVQMQPRRFSIAERGLLDRVLSDLYAGVDPVAPLEAMPILENVIVRLEALNEMETNSLARDLRFFLAGSLEATFNAPTTVDWDFGSDINYFDFSETRVPRTLQAFFYGQCVGAINRYMNDPRRDRRRPTLLLIDEYHLVARTESVARMAAELAKYARKHRIAVMPVDQNPVTFLGEKWTRIIWENATGKAIFHLDDLPAREIGEAISDLTDDHLQYITHAQPGEAVLVLGNDVYVAHIETNPREARAFAGS